MKKRYEILGLLLVMISITILNSGCAQTCQRIKADGSIIGTVSGAWVVEKMSGGIITDVYILDNALVKSEQGSDGWLFLDKNGNPVHIGGDMKAIRCNNNPSEVSAQYIEYHMDIDLCTYKEKFERVKGIPNK
jgi:hypothetical protein